MKYLDFADRVLTLARDAADRAAVSSTSPVSLMEIATAFGNEEGTTFHATPLHVALSQVIEDLGALVLVTRVDNLWIRPTPNGRQVASQGLRSQWLAMVHQLPLSSEARRFLVALCSVCEAGDDSSELALTDSDAVLNRLGEQWTPPTVIGIWNELEERHCVRGRVVSGGRVIGARPTYVGLVLATQSNHVRLQRLVQELVDDWEGATVDHKVRLEVRTDKQKAELTKDILALANTQARGDRYFVVGFGDDSRAFEESFDVSIDKDRLEDILGTRANAVPALTMMAVPWPGGIVGLIQVIRDPLRLPYRISHNLTEKIRAGDVFVRRGSHVAKADAEELADLEAEAAHAKEDRA